jgi:secreted trypsin-like serine protease
MSDSGGVLDTDDLYVLLGTLDNQDTESGELVKVRRIIDHPDYDPEKTSSDIALLELEKSVSGYTPVELYRGSDTLADTPCTVIGWGNTVGYNHPDEAEDPWMLRHVSISIVSQEQCIQAYSSDEIDSTMMCAGTEEGGKDSCQGDSGGPLVIKEGGVWKQAGVVSWGGGSECAEKGSYGVYARVSEFISFIDGYTAGTSIWGKISVSVAGHDDLGVKNATVSVEGTDYKTVTNEQGRFSLMIPKGGISPGDYTVSVNASGLVSSTQPITVQGQEGEGIEVNKKLLLSQNGGIPGDFSGNNVLGLEDSIGILQFLTGKK